MLLQQENNDVLRVIAGQLTRLADAMELLTKKNNNEQYIHACMRTGKYYFITLHSGIILQYDPHIIELFLPYNNCCRLRLGQSAHVYG